MSIGPAAGQLFFILMIRHFLFVHVTSTKVSVGAKGPKARPFGGFALRDNRGPKARSGLENRRKEQVRVRVRVRVRI